MLIKYVSLYHRCVFLAQKYQEFNTKIYNMFYHLQYNTLSVTGCSFHLVELEHQQNPNETLLGRQVRR